MSIARRPSPASPISGVESGGGIGWGAGAALGVKLARPDAQVISILGDGSYIFSNSGREVHLRVNDAQAAGAHHREINNAMWGAVRRATLGMYPDGEAAKSNKPPFIDLDDLPAFGDDLRGLGRLWRAGQGPSGLARGDEARRLKAVDGGQQALLARLSSSRGGAGCAGVNAPAEAPRPPAMSPIAARRRRYGTCQPAEHGPLTRSRRRQDPSSTGGYAHRVCGDAKAASNYGDMTCLSPAGSNHSFPSWPPKRQRPAF